MNKLQSLRPNGPWGVGGRSINDAEIKNKDR
jgi:hypothetical protein